MQHIKKTILTLVALLTMTTQAWAQDKSLCLEIDGTSATMKYVDYAVDGKIYFTGSSWSSSNSDALTNLFNCQTITVDASCKDFSGTSLASLFRGFSVLTTINNLENLNTSSVTNMSMMFNECTALTTLDLSGWNTSKVENMMAMFSDCLSLTTIYVGDGWSTQAVTNGTYGMMMFYNCSNLTNWDGTIDHSKAHTGAGGYLTYKATPTNIPVDIDWNALTKTGTLTMPAGNVEVSVEYYPEAEIDGTLSGNNVPATTDEPLIVITGEGTLTGGTMQYAISTDGTKAPSEGWGENMPTAAGITEPGTYYVWYYIKGDDEHSDSEMMGPIAITIGAAPTYSVSLNKEGLNETEVNAWKAKSENVPEVELGSTDLQGVKKGEKVTVTYTGQKKVIGFKVEKKKSYGGL